MHDFCRMNEAVPSILIVTDSRGNWLSKYIFNYCLQLAFMPLVRNISGAGFETALKLIQSTNLMLYSMVVVVVGICDITFKQKCGKGTFVACNMSSDKLESVKCKIMKTKTYLDQHHVPVKFVCIPSVSLSSYQLFRISKKKLKSPVLDVNDLKLHQLHVENDVMLLNEFILSLNNLSGLKNVRWDRDLMKTCIKKRGIKKNKNKRQIRFIYKDLYDGVHPNERLRWQWYSRLIKSISYDLGFTTNTEME